MLFSFSLTQVCDIVDELEGSEGFKKEVECLLDVLESVNLLGQLVLEVTVA